MSGRVAAAGQLLARGHHCPAGTPAAHMRCRWPPRGPGLPAACQRSAGLAGRPRSAEWPSAGKAGAASVVRQRAAMQQAATVRLWRVVRVGTWVLERRGSSGRLPSSVEQVRVGRCLQAQVSVVRTHQAEVEVQEEHTYGAADNPRGRTAHDRWRRWRRCASPAPPTARGVHRPHALSQHATLSLQGCPLAAHMR